MEISQLYTKISPLPSEMKSEVNDFVDFLLAKRKKTIEKKEARTWMRKRRNNQVA